MIIGQEFTGDFPADNLGHADSAGRIPALAVSSSVRFKGDRGAADCKVINICLELLGQHIGHAVVSQEVSEL